MGVFLYRFIEDKKYIVIMVVSVFLCGLIFGFYQFHLCSQMIKDFFGKLFYLNIDGFFDSYQMYVIQGGLSIFICTYLSSSYLGHIGLLFFIFLKGIQISFSLYNVFTTAEITLSICLLIIIELVIELLFCLPMNVMCIFISIYVTHVTFYTEQNFNIKSLLNYKLNCLIFSLILFSISLAFRLYFIPMF